MAKLPKWLVTVDLDKSIQEIRGQLESEGFVVDNLLADVGCITGQANQETVNRSRQIAGILDISPDVPIQLPPPDEQETW